MADTNDGVQGSTTNQSDDLALLNVEESEEPKVEARGSEVPLIEEEDEEESETPELKSDEEEEEKDEETRDAERKLPPYDRPSMQDLKKEFPELFKKFPALRDVYYREQEFSQIFPTIEDAQSASTAADAYNNLSDKLLTGSSSELFNAVKSADQKAFDRLTESVLPTLYRMSPDAHWKAVSPVMQNLVRGFFVEGEKRDNENIKNAAEYLADFIFGDVRFAHQNPRNQRVEESEESKKLRSEREEFENQKYASFFSSVKSGLDNDMMIAIDIKKIDPDKIFSEFIKDTIMGKVRSEVDKQLASDKAHMRYMASLWEKAKNEGFNDSWKSRIQSAYLARAKSLIPSIRAKFVAEAQGSSAKNFSQKREAVERVSSRREPGAGGRTSRESGSQINAKNVDWSKTSDMDLLNGKVTYKR